jgi:hypothetical protein
MNIAAFKLGDIKVAPLREMAAKVRSVNQGTGPQEELRAFRGNHVSFIINYFLTGKVNLIIKDIELNKLFIVGTDT